MSRPYNIPFTHHLDYPEEEHAARCMMGDPKAMAWAWICGYARQLSRDEADIAEEDRDWQYAAEVTPEELIDTAMTHIDSKGKWGGDYISKGDLLDGVGTDPTLWDKIAIIKEIDIPQEKRNNFFSCSC